MIDTDRVDFDSTADYVKLRDSEESELPISRPVESNISVAAQRSLSSSQEGGPVHSLQNKKVSNSCSWKSILGKVIFWGVLVAIAVPILIFVHPLLEALVILTIITAVLTIICSAASLYIRYMENRKIEQAVGSCGLLADDSENDNVEKPGGEGEQNFQGTIQQGSDEGEISEVSVSSDKDGVNGEVVENRNIQAALNLKKEIIALLPEEETVTIKYPKHQTLYEYLSKQAVKCQYEIHVQKENLGSFQSALDEGIDDYSSKKKALFYLVGCGYSPRPSNIDEKKLYEQEFIVSFNPSPKEAKAYIFERDGEIQGDEIWVMNKKGETLCTIQVSAILQPKDDGSVTIRRRYS